MALIAFASAKGAPGVTLTAAALARTWPRRCIVADLDTAGGDLALRYRRADGEPLTTDTGLLSLAATVRGGGRTEIEEHLQVTESGLEVLTGVASPQQVRGLGPSWPSVAASLAAFPDADVLADCGRIVPGNANMPVLEGADALVMVTRSTLEEIAHLRERLVSLRDTLRIGHLDGMPVGVAVVTDARDAHSAPDTTQLLRSARLDVTDLGALALDPKTAEAIRTDTPRNLRRSLLLRSASDVTARLTDLLSSRRALIT